MKINILKKFIEFLQLRILVLQLQLRIKLRKEKLTVPNLPEPEYVIVHHGGGDWGFQQVNNYHKNKWEFKSSLGYFCGYHKWIEYSGRLIIARRDNEEGAHCVESGRPHFWNRRSIGICLQGNMENEKPTEFQLRTLKRELDKYREAGKIIKGHKEIVPTLCPGQNLWQWLAEYRK